MQVITVCVYHTDAEGYYGKNHETESGHRLNGTMITNEEGRYEFRTIKPAPYPGGRNPAHIHFVISGKNYSQQQFELLFEGDPLITERMKQDAKKENNFFAIRPLVVEKDGILRCTYDIKLRGE